MVLEGIGEEKALRIMARESNSTDPRYYVEKWGKSWRIHAAQYWQHYFMRCTSGPAA